MSPFLKTSLDGELFLDHSASPGFTPEQAQKLGMPAELVGEGKKMHAATLGCPHCGSHVLLNPMRKRPRAHCYQCDAYICDGCDIVRYESGYVHRTIKQIRDLILSGKWEVHGSMSLPLIVPK